MKNIEALPLNKENFIDDSISVPIMVKILNKEMGDKI